MELGNPIHCNGRKGGCIVVRGYGEQRRFCSGGICFVCLACGAPSYILLDEILHSWPPIVLENGKKSASYARMACCGCIMVLEHYLPLKLVVFHNNKVTRVPPMVVFGMKWEMGRKVLDCMHEEVLGT
jgi:hypothetical protein